MFPVFDDMLTGTSAAVFSHYLIGGVEVEGIVVSCDVTELEIVVRKQVLK